VLQVPVDDDLERLVKLREAIKAESMDRNEGDASHKGVQDQKAKGGGKQGGRKRRREDGEDELIGSKR
jgi:hypothetical protein